MQRFEYQVVPAPKKGEKSKTAKTTADRFAVALTSLMNKMGADGWEYQRADTLPCEERVGFTGSKTAFQNMLIFRREIKADTATAPRSTPIFAPIPAELFTDPDPVETEVKEDLPTRAQLRASRAY
ncbi:hypothetical protein SAMN05216227_100747 [Pseudorhodobacter antarcticus]|jgi:hypothetical protein|uniref:DUF4177 domain-containing protein n=1 Tax=Pseudorhodobacter antarcticus TaxID=1077947 RepID=A0A1H8DMH5_9RHOB|nr:DUF4177 domain-containing protein [Pseudorhodobacter antarcticus]SEN07984.1 hypothetical protein SAMN05216227_100747 [Pseudorhodobacter antarcticus]